MKILRLRVSMGEMPKGMEGAVRKAVRTVFAGEAIKGEWEVGVVFVPPEEMREVNKRYRHKDEVTDVLSFCYERGSAKQVGRGEIILCEKEIERRRKTREMSRVSSVVWLVVHACLHIIGYEHEGKRARYAMQVRERAYLRELRVKEFPQDWLGTKSEVMERKYTAARVREK